MSEENINPTPKEGVEPEGGQQPSNLEGSKVEEFNFETSDNVARLREHAKGLKTDLDKYKSDNEYYSKTFGDKSNAELAASVYGTFAGQEFDAASFRKMLNELSPGRAKALFDIAPDASAVETAAKSEIKKLFGSDVSDEEVKLFKKFKETGYGLAGDDLPDAFKFNADGTPKSDEEIAFIKGLQDRVNEVEKATKQKAADEAATAEQTKEGEVATAINDFGQSRIKALDPEFEARGLAPTATDTADQRTEKEFIKQFIIDGVTSAFLKTPEGSQDYNSAIGHIRNGETLLARRYEASIEDKLIKLMRSPMVGKLLQPFVTEAPPTIEDRPELSNPGSSQTEPKKPSERETADQLFDRMVREGKIKV